MTNTELTKIREEKKLSKGDFAKLLGISPMLLGKYEKGSSAIPEGLEEKLQELSDAAAVAEIELKKNTRAAAGKAKEAAGKVAAEIAEAVEDKVVAEEIEAKKTAREAGRKIKEAAGDLMSAVGFPNIVIQSPMGGYITPADIAKKVPKGTSDVYVRVDENKLYYVLKDGVTGSVNIWD